MAQGAHDARALQAALTAATAGIELRFRPMFSGIMGYMDGRPFASLSNVGLALKLASADAAALREGGGQPLRYEPDDPPSRSYTLVPDPMLDEPAALRVWVERSRAFVLSRPVEARRR